MLSACPLPDATLLAIVFANVLHHLPVVRSEARWCLEPGGKTAMIEPSKCPTLNIPRVCSNFLLSVSGLTGSMQFRICASCRCWSAIRLSAQTPCEGVLCE